MRSFTPPGRFRSSRRELADNRNRVLRLWPDGVVRIHVGGTDSSVLVNDISGGHRQAKVLLVVKPVERVPERLVQLLQIAW